LVPIGPRIGVVRSGRVIDRLHHLDALRAFAMFLGIVLHAALAYTGGPWIVRDAEPGAPGSGAFVLLYGAIHGFRMELFFLLSGFFTALLWRRRGLAGMLRQRAARIGLPLLVGLFTVVPLVWITIIWAGDAQGVVRSDRPAGPHPPLAVALWLLFRFPLFHHLWFLWFLCWMIAGFALIVAACPRGVAGCVRLWLTDAHSSVRWAIASPRALAWLLPLTVVTFAAMAPTRETPGFGTDTSASLLPLPGVLAHHALFFAFGALLHEVPSAIDGFARRWMLAGVAAAFLLPVGMSFAFAAEWTRALVPSDAARGLVSWTAQSLYAWLGSMALLGGFAQLATREHRAIRFLSDSSYWLYIAHLPLVIAGQILLLRLPWPPFAKFAMLLAGSTALLLASYRWGVRDTVVGRLLNGPRPRP
jgi:surface polysaccharide O-acyltransferase-like enzyme